MSEKPKATRCNSGDKILSYMLRLIFGKKIMDRPYVYFFFIFFFFFFETSMKTSRYLVNSFLYNSGTSQNDFWIKETDKRAQNGDKKKPKTP
jgi:hypothetical protein